MSSEQGNGARNYRMLACYEEILKEEQKRSLSRQTLVLDFFMSSSGTCAIPPVLLDIGDDDPDDPPTVQEEVPLSYIAICF
jgi:hypothetical protein